MANQPAKDAKSGKPSTRNQSSSKNRREALREAQLKAAKQERTKKIAWIAGTLVVLVAVILVIVFAVMNRSGKQNGDETNVDPGSNQIVPPNATSNHSGIIDPDSKNPDAKLKLVIFTDFQCPGCKTAHLVLQPYLSELAQNGDIVIEQRTKYFLDQYPIMEIKNSSQRAAIAAACADTVGKYSQYFHEVFSHQPKEGKGYPETQLRDEFSAGAGITGDDLAKFQQCYDNRETGKFVTEVDQFTDELEFNATPTFYVNGKKWNWGEAVADESGRIKQDLSSAMILESLQEAANR